MIRIFHNTNYDFLKWWKAGLFARIAFIVIGLAIMAVNGLHFSIEFTGGTMMQVQFAKPPGGDAVRDAVTASGFPGSQIQPFGSNREFTIRAQPRAGDATTPGDSTRMQIERTLHQRFGDTTQVKVVSAEFVGPTVGAELRRNAVLAVLTAFIVTLAYLAFRFEWRFAVAAVVANAHEIFATFAFLAIMRLEFSLTVLAAILTVIGYSLNDTIIIFDRVREDRKRRPKDALRDIVNRSINETLPRSVLTHVTVFAASLSLLIFAGPVLRPFSWIMAFGVFTATFTSIYISGSLLLWIEHTWPRKMEGRPGRGSGQPAAQVRTAAKEKAATP
jgi:preprotein translocase subunit SecF